MSDDKPTNESAESSPAPVPAPESSGAARQIGLVALLIVMAGALGYDRMVARPACEAAYAKLETLKSDYDKSASGTKELTQKQVKEAIGKDPTITEEGKFYFIETYKWMGGLPWKHYKVHVLYRKYVDESKTPEYRNAYMNDDVPDEDKPSGPMTAEDIAEVRAATRNIVPEDGDDAPLDPDHVNSEVDAPSDDQATDDPVEEAPADDSDAAANESADSPGSGEGESSDAAEGEAASGTEEAAAESTEAETAE